MVRMHYYFDFISPYAYLGWSQVKTMAERRGLELRPVPVLFAAMLNAFGHKGPAEIGPKRVYAFKHVLRLAHDLGLPLVPPPAHPFNPLLALRLASAAEREHQRAVIDLLYQRTWGTGEGCTDADALVAALDARGLPGAVLLAAASTSEAKDRLRRDTERALEIGVFGVPSIEVHGEVFWGQDSMPHIERLLDGDDPISADLLDRWVHLPKGALRTPPGS